MKLRVGTRRSTLARAQTGLVRRMIGSLGIATEEVLVTSDGDVDRTRPLHEAAAAGPGLFTRALEDALRARTIDVAVHSLKDLPLAVDPELPVVAIPLRADARDVLVVREDFHMPERAPLPLRPGARVGTSSPRRQTQLLALDPEAVATDIRGNVETRLGLVTNGVVDAVLLAKAGLDRSGIAPPAGTVTAPLPLDAFPACPGQGALAIQARAASPEAAALAALDDHATRLAADAERALLAHLGGGCGMPLGATFRREGDAWRLDATLAADAWHVDPSIRRASLAGPDALALARQGFDALAKAPPPEPRARGSRLAGKRVLLTFDAETAAPYVDAILREGGEARAWPTTAHDPIPLAPIPRDVADAWRAAQWVVVASPRGVRAAAALAVHPREGAPRYGAVGPATARAMRAAGLPVHLVAPDGTGAGLARAVAAWTPPEGPVLAPGAADPTPDLAEGLRAAGFRVVPWAVYRTRAAPAAPPPFALPVDALVVTAPSAAAALPAGALARRVVAFGPSTAEALKSKGVVVHAVAPRRSPEGVLEALLS